MAGKLNKFQMVGFQTWKGWHCTCWACYYGDIVFLLPKIGESPLN